MKAINKFFTPLCIGLSFFVSFFLLKDYVYVESMKEQEIFKIQAIIFIPLFLIGFIVSIVLTNKKHVKAIMPYSLLLTGMCVVLLGLLNIYNLQMILPLMKTNSISLAVMWITRILGGIIGLFIGLSAGAVGKGKLVHFLLLLIGVGIGFCIREIAGNEILYVQFYYAIGTITILCSLLNSKLQENREMIIKNE